MGEDVIDCPVLFSESGSSPAPFQDYHQILVSKDEVIFRTWKVTPRKIKATPCEVKIPHVEFQHYKETKNDIGRVFGRETLNYVSNLARGHIDYLPRMPEKILMKIISNLDLEDYINISKISYKFNKLCQNEAIWEKLFYKHHNMTPCMELQELAIKTGWKQLTFCSILQLKVQLLKHTKCKGNIEVGAGEFVGGTRGLKGTNSVTSLRRLISNENASTHDQISNTAQGQINNTTHASTDLNIPKNNSNYYFSDLKAGKSRLEKKVFEQYGNLVGNLAPDTILPRNIEEKDWKVENAPISASANNTNRSRLKNSKYSVSMSDDSREALNENNSLLLLSATGRLDKRDGKTQDKRKERPFYEKEDSFNSH